MKTSLSTPWNWKLPTLTREQATQLDEWFAQNKLSAAASAPVICSPECKYKDDCPLSQLAVPLPFGLQCPVERTLFREAAVGLASSLGIAEDDAWSLALIEYASLWKLLMRRALLEAGRYGVVVDSYRGVDKEGNALYEKKVNPALIYVERVQKVLREIGEDLIATRRAKAKLDQTERPKSPEDYVRDVRKRIQDAAVALLPREAQIIDVTVEEPEDPTPPPPPMPSESDDPRVDS